MALRAVPDHPKFSDLKHRIGKSKGATLGYLECVWHFTGRFTPQGNIGKYADAAIEGWVEWEGEPGALIFALVESHWIDRDPVHRLLVHDWEQHADKSTKQALTRTKSEFCVPTTVREILPALKSGKSLHEAVNDLHEDDFDLHEDRIDPHEDQIGLHEGSQNAKPISMIPHEGSLNTKTVSVIGQPVPVPVPVPEPVPVPAPPKTQNGFEGWFEKRWARHRKTHRDEPKDLVASTFVQEFTAGKLDLAEFERLHDPYCDSWEGEWKYNTETLLVWYRNGMHPASRASPGVLKKSRQEEINDKILNGDYD